jgi:hypothetical protein
MVVGAAMVAVSAAGLVVGFVTTRWALQRQTNLEAARADIDDLVKVARAAGILLPTVEGGRSSGQMAAAIAFHAPTPILPLIEDEQLLDRCDECRTATTDGGHCPHDRTLCGDCRPTCLDCLIDLRSQGTLSQYVPEWWTR